VGKISPSGTNAEPLSSDEGERGLICLSAHGWGRIARKEPRLWVTLERAIEPENRPAVPRNRMEAVRCFHDHHNPPSALFSHGFTPDSERPRWIKDFLPASRGPTLPTRRW